MQQYYKAKEDSRRDEQEAGLISFEEPKTSRPASSLNVARPTVCSDIRRRESFARMSETFQANVPQKKRWRLSMTNSLAFSKEENDSENHSKHIS